MYSTLGVNFFPKQVHSHCNHLFHTEHIVIMFVNIQKQNPVIFRLCYRYLSASVKGFLCIVYISETSVSIFISTTNTIPKSVSQAEAVCRVCKTNGKTTSQTQLLHPALKRMQWCCCLCDGRYTSLFHCKQQA